MADVVLITGASRGIGLATAECLAKKGVRVIGVARTPPKDFPGRFVSIDLGDEAAAEDALAALAAEEAIEGIVNNVGLNVLEPLGAVSIENFRRVIDINLRVTIQATQAVLPGMLKHGYGRIVNLSSRGALGREQRTSYAAAKAGVVGMTRTWALELAEKGITANVVSPGPTATEMFVRNNLSGPDAEEARAKWTADVPMRRFGEPHEVAAGIAFFLSKEASFVTGQVLHVCGGASVGVAAL